MREYAARNAAEGTYETIKRATIYARPQSAEEVDAVMLDRLARRRSWRRLNERTFVVRWFRATATVLVEVPLEPTAFFSAVTEAEIRVFCGDVEPEELERLLALGRTELQRLFARDGLPWANCT
jgi:hypothetical protein